jgi:MOSC domain-containing protein YiiM
MAFIASIVYTPARVDPRPATQYARVPLEQAMLLEGIGIEGDLKGGPRRKRQLNVMAREMLDQLATEGFKTSPGEMGEQIVISGIDLTLVNGGDRLRLGGSVVIEAAYPRTGCTRFERIQGYPKGSVAGRLGIMACVVASGLIRVGDPVELLPADG